jgi:UDP-N-acetylmuramoylalanine--D-glutamate ligase
VIPDGRALVVGLGITGRAVAHALVGLGRDVVVVEDHPRDELGATAESLGVSLVAAPDAEQLRAVVRDVAVAFPSPGVPERHPVFAELAARDIPVRSEFDLASALDDRPVVAVTGTDGKTTVTSLVTAMLEASGRRAASVGNTEVPLVAAIEDPDIEVFVVEASSFRLAHTERFVPRVATWLNFGADHQDVHRSPAAYEDAKARIWRDLGAGEVAVANAEDPVVMRHVRGDVPTRTFGRTTGDYRVEDGVLVGEGEEIVGIDELPRSLPHDVTNSLAAAATAVHGGGGWEGVRAALRSFTNLPHRVQFVAEVDGVAYYDDSKATTPHATRAALAGFASVVLIAGGRNKGLDLAELREGVSVLRAVVAIGEASGEVADVFDGVLPVVRAASMEAAVAEAAQRARAGDVVLLSPACASFDWYGSYAERGDDFTRRVRALAGQPTEQR